MVLKMPNIEIHYISYETNMNKNINKCTLTLVELSRTATKHVKLIVISI